MKPREVADVFRFERSTIYEKIEAGELEAHRSKARKSHFRITRRSVIAKLALGVTRPLPEMPAVLLYCASTLSAAQRAKLVTALERSGSK